jgi:hypothetical protein
MSPGTFAVTAPIANRPSVNRVLLTRQAAMPLWTETTRNINYAIDYAGLSTQTHRDNFPAIGTSSPLNTPASGWRSTQLASTMGGTNVVTVVTTQASYNTYPIIGVDAATGDQPWLYVPRDCTVGFYLACHAGHANVVTMTTLFEVWLGPGEVGPGPQVDITNQTAGNTSFAGTAIFSATDNLWVRPLEFSTKFDSGAPSLAADYNYTVVVSSAIQSMTYSAAAYGGSVSIGSSTKMILAPQVVAPEFANSPLPYTATRVTGLAVGFTNVTKIMNKEGTVMAGRVLPAQRNIWNLDDDFVSTLHPAEKFQTGLETGLYSFVPPSSDTSIFADYVSPLPGTAGSTPQYRLDLGSTVNYINFNDTDGGTTLAFSLFWNIEFRTTSTLFPIALCRTTLETYHRGMLDACARGYFFPGPEPTFRIMGPVKPSVARPTTARASGWTGKSHTPKVAKPRPSSRARSRTPKPQRPTTRTTPAPKPRARMASGLDMYLASRAGKR